MWTMNRFQRPGWVTGVCIAVSFLCAIFAGGIEWWEVSRRKKLQKLGIVAPPMELERNFLRAEKDTENGVEDTGRDGRDESEERKDSGIKDSGRRDSRRRDSRVKDSRVKDVGDMA